jgi:hypothetical protein
MQEFHNDPHLQKHPRLAQTLLASQSVAEAVLAIFVVSSGCLLTRRPLVEQSVQLEKSLEVVDDEHNLLLSNQVH